MESKHIELLEKNITLKELVKFLESINADTDLKTIMPIVHLWLETSKERKAEKRQAKAEAKPANKIKTPAGYVSVKELNKTAEDLLTLAEGEQAFIKMTLANLTPDRASEMTTYLLHHELVKGQIQGITTLMTKVKTKAVLEPTPEALKISFRRKSAARLH